jgi:hypothetical protein
METEYYECTYCSYGISGDPSSTYMLRKMDEHDDDCQGTMRLVSDAG